MKLLVLTNNLHSDGGIQQYSRDFLQALKDNGFSFFHLELRTVKLIAKIIFVLRAWWQVLFRRPDFILVNHLNYAPLAYLFYRLYRIPYAVLVYGIEVWEIQAKAKQQALRSARVIISISEFTSQRMLAKGYVVQEQLKIIPPTLNTDFFKPQSKSEILLSKHKLQNKKVIFTLCRLSAVERYKGYDRVIQALPRVLQSVPEAVYVLAGDGDDRPRVEQLAKELGLQKKVFFTGWPTQEEKTDYYNLADVFIMPSTSEGFGIVFLEALSCGVPVIAGNLDASPEPLLQGKIGILLNPNDISAISQSLIAVLTGAVVKTLLTKEFLRRTVVANFGIAAFRQKVGACLREIEHGLQR